MEEKQKEKRGKEKEEKEKEDKEKEKEWKKEKEEEKEKEKKKRQTLSQLLWESPWAYPSRSSLNFPFNQRLRRREIITVVTEVL